MAEYRQIVKMMTYLAALYPRFDLTEATVNAYYSILKDIEDGLLRAAAEQIGASSTFFPAAAELRKAAFGIAARAKGIPSPAEAWGEVMQEVRRVGNWGHPEFSDDLVTRTVDGLGGWAMLCASDNSVADRAHFLKIYGALLERHDQDAIMLPEIREMIAEMSARMEVPQVGRGDESG